ncbi:MAG: rod shape-determining protein MreC [bacterium]|nr:rod shape-determining protein MreC [bacterium]
MKARLNIKLYQNIKKIIAVLLLLAIVVVVLNFTGVSKNIKNFFFLISSPIQKSFWQAGKNVSGFAAGILEARILKKEIDNLHFENQELLSQIVALKELKKENETLREALGLGLEKEFELMVVRVINKDISQDSILVDKGGKDGVLSGWPVITGQKVLLGKIGQVYDRFSEVILISNKESSFGAKIPEREIDGIVKGKGSFNLYFDLIPREKEISEAELVITSVLGGVYPQGLLVGEIKTIRKSDIEPFQTAEITPLFNVKNLDYLFIITSF